MKRNHSENEMGERRPETREPFHIPHCSALAPVACPATHSTFPGIDKALSRGGSSFIPHPFAQQASSLITTLLVLVVLSTIVVAFMQSMSIERSVAKSVANKERAVQAARSGLDRLLAGLSVGSGFHFTVGSTTVSGTNKGSQIFLHPSGSTNVSAAIDLFSKPEPGMPAANILIASGETVLANFNSIKEAGGATNSRYAFWAEPETFKQNTLLWKGSTRGKLTNLSEMALLQTNLSTWPSNSYITNYSSYSNYILTPDSVVQILPNTNGGIGNRFYYALKSTSPQLTPEGYPKLNLFRLKTILDNTINYPLTQGPASKRVTLLKQLLNEGGTNSATNNNPWGYGSFSFLTNNYPLGQARQIVADIMDYVDEDLIPTTDGNAGIKPSNLDITSGSKVANDPNAIFSIQSPPTFLGQEARATSNGALITITGHPLITYLGSGIIINAGSNPINSTRILGWAQIVNPWESDVNWRLGGSDGYFVDMQVRFGGDVTAPSRGTTPQGTGSSGYFLTAALAQISGYDGSHSGRTISTHGKVMFPREWAAGGNDLANGFYTINNPAITINNFTQTPEVARLVYVVNSQRYIIQDLGLLAAVPRTWTPASAALGGASVVIKHPYAQQDWHYVGDPRLSSLSTNNWKLATTAGAAFGPVNSSAGNAVYSSATNSLKDARQGMTDSELWWQTANVTNHFPTYSQGYRASMPAGLPPMVSYSEFGFIWAGNAWQTLSLQKRPGTTNEPYADWRIADYVDLGLLPETTNAFRHAAIDGLVNPNTYKTPTVAAAFEGVVSNSSGMATNVMSNAIYPMHRASDVFGIASGANLVVTNTSTNDFSREQIYGQIAPILTPSSYWFSIYCSGQSLSTQGKVNATATLEALVELVPDSPVSPTRYKPEVRFIKTY